MNLVNIPFDVLENILCNVDARTVLACNRTCKHLRHTVAASLTLQYIIALAARGLRDGPNKSLGLSEKLEKLNQYELAWRRLSWKESLRFELPSNAGSRHVYQADGYLMIVHPPDSRAQVIRLPSPLRGVSREDYSWLAPEDFYEWEGFALMDPHHDLVAFLRATSSR